MLLYHTSYTTIQSPDILHSRDFLDFGKGFYLTTIKEQAEKYGERFKKRGKEAWLNVYDFDFQPLEWEILKFDSYDREWLNFIANCRGGNDTSKYNLVIGGIADDKVIQTLDRYFNGEINETEALGLLKYEKPNIQYCVRSQEMIDKCLSFKESKQL